MKQYFIILFLCFTSITLFAQEQRVIWHDEFETDKGWTLSDYRGIGKAEITKNEALLVKSKEGKSFVSKCKTNLNPQKNFTILVEAKPSSAYSSQALYVGKYFGIVFNYLDERNFMYCCIEKGYAYFVEVRNGDLYRRDYDAIKNSKDKIFTLEVKKIGSNILFIVNEEEVLEIERVEIEASKIGLFVSGEIQVEFDNVKILQ